MPTAKAAAPKDEMIYSHPTMCLHCHLIVEMFHERGADPVREIQRKDLKELITKGLSRAERLIIILYYFEEMTMKEIGATLDLSESRVSQMHTSIIMRLKAQMADRKKEFAQAAAG